MSIQTVTIERILPTAIWIEDDLFGARHVMLQHEGMEPFCYASFHYGYAYTSNSGTWAAATELAKALGAAEPIEHRHRPFNMPDHRAADAEYLSWKPAAAGVGVPHHQTKPPADADGSTEGKP